MDVLNWFIALDHVKIINYTYFFLAFLLLINVFFKNLNVISLFLPLLIVGIIDSQTGHELVVYLGSDERISYRWTQYLYFSIFNVLNIFIIFKRKTPFKTFGLTHQYQLYTQEIGLVLISISCVVVQFVSMSNWFFYYATGEYSMFIHGMYALLKTILLGLTWMIFVTLFIQNIFGLIKKKTQGVINA